MSIAPSLKQEIEKEIQKSTRKQAEIIHTESVHGGDIHAAFKVITKENTYFLKTSEGIPPHLFKKEFNGLQLLKKKNVIAIPKPIAYGTAGKHEFLLLEFIEKKSADSHFWETFAKKIAALHQCTAETFGFQEDNYIGPLPQPNSPYARWSDFYISQRLQPLIRKCIDQNLLEKTFIDKAMQLYNNIPDIFPEEKPALLHGDLWGGNYLCGPDAQPYLFDPAVYYGHREIDLAMTRLFGGFDRRFYWNYNDHFPLAPEWQKRIRLCQLYPLLVHSLLFGGGYVQQVRSIIKEYG